jgi:DUF4097 and DUF4098 domain-containing protein YvlB
MLIACSITKLNEARRIRRSMLKTKLKIVFAACMLSAAAFAQQGKIYQDGGNWVQEVSGSLATARKLHIRVEAGAVYVEGGSQPGITYKMITRVRTSSEEKARRQFDQYKLSASLHGDTASIEAECGSPHKFSGEYTITVPRDMELVKIETDGGAVSAKGISGRVEAETGGGKVHLEDIGGDANVETGGDAIEVDRIGGDLTAETGGGKLYLGSVKGLVNATTGGGDVMLLSGGRSAVLESGAGDIQVKQVGGDLKITTGGGNIDVDSASGPISVETAGGSIRIGWAKGLVRAETAAGRIELNGIPAVHAETASGGILARFIVLPGDHTDSVLETANGDIVVYLPVNFRASIRAAIEAANGQRIYSDFPEIPVRMEGNADWPQTITAEGSLNGGGPTIKVQTVSGNISFKRANQ